MDWWGVILNSVTLFGAIYWTTSSVSPRSLARLGLGVFCVVSFVIGVQPKL